MGKITWNEARRLERGHTFDDSPVLYVTKDNGRPDSGYGGGGSAPSVTWVCANGDVWNMQDPGWMRPDAANPRRLYRGMPC